MHTSQDKSYGYAVDGAPDVDWGACIPGRVQVGTLGIMMSTYSASLNKLPPGMGRLLHTMQYTDHVSQKCKLEAYIILSDNVIPIHLMIKSEKQSFG